MNDQRYQAKHGDGGLDSFTASGAWVGSCPNRNEVVELLNNGIDEWLRHRDRVIDEARKRAGNKIGPRVWVSYSDLWGRCVGGGHYCGTRAEVTAQLVEDRLCHAYAPYDYRFELRGVVIGGEAIDAEVVLAIYEAAA